MHLYQYFPEPDMVPGRVSQEPYPVLTAFIKRVSVLHFLTITIASVLALQMPMLVKPGMAWAIFGAGLLALTIIRRIHDGGWMDNLWSSILLVPTVFAVAQLGHIALGKGWPLWALPLSAFFAAIYVVACGRDFSFSGQAVLGIIVSWIAAAALAMLGWIDAATALKAGLTSMIYLIYYSFDLAMILHRRRRGELPAATADFFRDMINFLTYALRIFLHWRKFRFQP